MADNKEEHAGDQRNATSENSLAETTLAQKKKWRGYFLEFFMIFLAVFLGFLAENIREHFGEQQQAREYAQALYNDLKKDTVELNRIINFKKWRNAKLDSLIILMNYSDHQKIARELYHYSCYATLPDLMYKPSEIAIQQLRSTGSLRYFNVQLYTAITRYYNQCNFYTEKENDNLQFIPPVTLTSKIFRAEQIVLMYSNVYEIYIRNVIKWPAKKTEFSMSSSYGEAWNEYSMYIRRQRIATLLPVRRLSENVKKDLLELMALLRKEYQVK